jgi:hypothetical protein
MMMVLAERKVIENEGLANSITFLEAKIEKYRPKAMRLDEDDLGLSYLGCWLDPQRRGRPTWLYCKICTGVLREARESANAGLR